MGSYEYKSLPAETQVELDFEQQNWTKARRAFLEKHKNKDSDALQSFLQSQTTGLSVKQECLDLQRKSDSKYQKGFGNILDKIDSLMTLGDLAIKSAPESVGLAWCGIRMCLHAIQGDFATFQLFGGACADIVGIMISCRVYGKMYGNRQGPEDFIELHDKVLQYIPGIYVEILDFSYAVRKYTNKHIAIRIGKNIFKDVKGDFQSQITAIQAHEQEMRGFAKIATERLLVHSQDQMLVEIGDMSKMLDANLRANEIFVRHIEALEEERKELRRKTPLEEAQEEFEMNNRELNPSADQSEILSENLDVRREPGTCQWIFDLETYKKWYSSSDDNMLWVSGAAGYGKSILMSTVIEKLKTEPPDNESHIVHYFFCKTGEESTQSTQRILQTLVFQLYATFNSDLASLEKANDVFRTVLGKEGKGQSKIASKSFNFESLYGGLLKVLDRDLYLVIDAIDECNDRQDKRLLQALKSVAENSKEKFKVILCSRPEADISNTLHNIPNISCESHNEGDIRKNVASLMDKFPGWTPSEKVRASDVIVRKAGGQFRYVQVALQVLRKPLMRPYERALENLPDGLIGSYASSWRMTNPDYIDLLKTSLTWAILAARPVTVPEVMDAYSRTYSSEFGVNEEQEDAKEDDDEANLHDSQIRTAGGNFLEVSGTREISLRHATVKDFFLKITDGSDALSDPKSSSPDSSNQNSETRQPEKIVSEWLVDPKQGHLDIARTLIQNLISPAFQKKYLWAGTNDTKVPEDDKVSSPPSPSSKEEPDREESSVDRPKSSSSKDNQVQENHMVDGDPVASPAEPKSNEDDIADTLPSPPSQGQQEDKTAEAEETDDASSVASSESADSEDYVDVREQSGHWKSLDEKASAEQAWKGGHRYEISHWQYHLQQALKLWSVQERESNVEWKEIWSNLASFMNNISAFDPWLQHVAKERSSLLRCWDARSNLKPLHVAATFGLEDMVKLLIDQGHNIDDRVLDGEFVTPLEKICFTGETVNIPMMRLLLENGASPNELGDKIFPAFHDAIQKDPSTQLINLFLSHGAKVDLTDFFGYNCMHWFSSFVKDPEAVKLLVDAGANINVVDNEGETPLHWLLRRQDLDIKVLEAYLAAGARVDIEDTESQSNCEAAELLIAHGADIHDDDCNGLTALHAAAKRGKVNMVKLFLEKGLPPNEPDQHGRTPLYHACQGGNKETVSLLLETLKDLPDTEINAADSKGRTPFRKAAIRGNIDILNLMLAKADLPTAINSLSLKNGRNTVHGAAFNGEIAALKILIEAGADLSITDKDGLTALELCGQGWSKSSSKSNEDCLVFLIEQDPKTAVKCSDLLFKAAQKGSKRVVDKLLETGIDPMITDEHGWTPLLLAQQHNQQEVAEHLARKKSTVRSRPTKWLSPAKHIKLAEEGLQVEETSRNSRQTTIISDHPVPAGETKFYFEVHIVYQPLEYKGGHEPVSVVGYTTRPMKQLNLLPGHYAVGVQSWAYHGDDGGCYSSEGSDEVRIGTYGTGDIIGCAIDFTEKAIFFTRNGERLPTSFSDVYGRLYPAIGTESNVILKANFGADLDRNPWKWQGYKEWIDEVQA